MQVIAEVEVVFRGSSCADRGPLWADDIRYPVLFFKRNRLENISKRVRAENRASSTFWIQFSGRSGNRNESSPSSRRFDSLVLGDSHTARLPQSGARASTR